MSGSLSTTRREAAVDGLRGLMLLVIVLTHYIPATFFSANIARPAAAVMLSVTGYFLMRIIDREAAFDGSIAERCHGAISLLFQRHMRIWPVLLGVILMYVVLGMLAPSPTTTQIHSTWPMYLGYMGNIIKMQYEADAFPAHFWLISAQEQFVLFVVAALVCIGRTRLKGFLELAVIVGVLARLIGGVLWMPDRPALATENPLAVADALALGMLCRIAIRSGAGSTALRRRLLVAALLIFFVWAALPNTYAVYFGLMPLLAALVGCQFILTLADEVRVRKLERAMLSWPAVVLLGQMSLSLFLLHPLVNTLLNLAYASQTGDVIPWWLLSMVGPPASILVAYAYFRTVEVPIRRFRAGRRRAHPTGRAQASPTTATWRMGAAAEFGSRVTTAASAR